jgi:hypothetical protein
MFDHCDHVPTTPVLGHLTHRKVQTRRLLVCLSSIIESWERKKYRLDKSTNIDHSCDLWYIYRRWETNEWRLSDTPVVGTRLLTRQFPYCIEAQYRHCVTECDASLVAFNSCHLTSWHMQTSEVEIVTYGSLYSRTGVHCRAQNFGYDTYLCNTEVLAYCHSLERKMLAY